MKKNLQNEFIEAIILLVLLCSTILSLFQCLWVGIPAVAIIVWCIVSLVRKVKARLK
ncbi:MAG: hypothetical protein SNG81_04270 [Rikenellaceae bacterium]